MPTARKNISATLHPDTVEIVHRAGLKMMERTGSMSSPSLGKVLDMFACFYAAAETEDPEQYRRYADLLTEYNAWPQNAEVLDPT